MIAVGLLETRWAATYRDHLVTVTRNEMSRGFALEWDGRPVAVKRWCLVGIGTISGEVDLDGGPVAVSAELTAGSKCTLIVGDESVDCRRVG